MNKLSKEKFRIVVYTWSTAHIFQAQVKKWWRWKDVGSGRFTEERAMEELKICLDFPKTITRQQIIDAKGLDQ